MPYAWRSVVRLYPLFAGALIAAALPVHAQEGGSDASSISAGSTSSTGGDGSVSNADVGAASGTAPAADNSASSAAVDGASGSSAASTDASSEATVDSISVGSTGSAAATPPATNSASESDTRQRLPDVVVSSQKIQQTLEEVPISVSTIDGEAMRKSGLNTIADVQSYVPNVSININGTSATFAIRGFATPDTNPGFDPSVGAVIDGVYYGRSQFIAPFFYDIDRLEVLRGPQGTLFGKNSTAGVLNLVTKAPENEFALGLDTLFTGYGKRVYNGMAQFPIGSDISVRVTGSYTHAGDGNEYNTFLKREENQPEPRTVRIRARYTPDENATLDVEAFTSHEKMNNDAFQFSSITPKMLQLIQSYDPQAEAKVDRTNSANFAAQSDGTIKGVSTTFNYDLSNRFGIPELNVTTIMSGAQSLNVAKDLDADFSPVNFVNDRLATPALYRQTTDEVRIAGRGDNFLNFGHGYDFVGGAFLSSSTFHTDDVFSVESLGGAAAYCFASASFCGLASSNPIPLPGGVDGIFGQTLSSVIDRVNQLAGGALDQTALVDIDQKGKSYSLFGQFEAYLLEHWALIGGVRYGNETKTAVASSQSSSLLIKAITSQQDHVTPLSINEIDYSPKAGIKWQADKNLGAFLTFGRGYKSGGFNARPLSPDKLTYEPEQATSVELGTKALVYLGDGPMRLSATIYQTRFDNLQVSSFIGGNFVVLNAASAVSRGFDFDFHWLTPAHGFSVTGSAGFADASYRSYPCAPSVADSTALNTNPSCVTPDMSSQQQQAVQKSTQDLSGKRLSFAPRWTASLIPAYQLPVESVLTTLAVEVLYRGDRYLDVDLDPKKLQASTTVINSRLTLESPTHLWAFSVVGHNLTNEVFSDQAISQPLAPGGVLYYRTDFGRYVSGNVTLSF